MRSASIRIPITEGSAVSNRILAVVLEGESDRLMFEQAFTLLFAVSAKLNATVLDSAPRSLVTGIRTNDKSHPFVSG